MKLHAPLHAPLHAQDAAGRPRCDSNRALSAFVSPARLLEECFLTRDPFSPDREKFLILGAECSLCRKRVCVGSVRGITHRARELLITRTAAERATAGANGVPGKNHVCSKYTKPFGVKFC